MEGRISRAWRAASFLAADFVAPEPFAISVPFTKKSRWLNMGPNIKVYPWKTYISGWQSMRACLEGPAFHPPTEYPAFYFVLACSCWGLLKYCISTEKCEWSMDLIALTNKFYIFLDRKIVECRVIVLVPTDDCISPCVVDVPRNIW